jgi:tetratricopeptide (TPR) repeat protein
MEDEDNGPGRARWYDRLEDCLGGRMRVVGYIVLFQILAAVYYPCLRGEFLYDDIPSIAENPDFRSSPLSVFQGHESSLQFDRRPVGGLLTWLNFRVFGLRPAGYHLVNLFLHALLAVALCELILRIAGRIGVARPRLIAFTIVSIWALHPLNSMPVAYIYQRMEQLMSLFFVLTLFCLLAGDGRGKPWLIAAWICALLSLLSKEVAVLLPIAMLVAERIFNFPNWKMLLIARRGFYASLLVAWFAVGFWFLGGSRVGELSGSDPLSSPSGYFMAQCAEVFNYLKLVFWPEPLIFFRTPRFATGLLDWLPHLIVLLSLAGLVVLAARRRPWIWLAATVFVAVLAPTSSVIPVPLEPAAEFRMYLPSSVVIVLAVALGVWLIQRICPPPEGIALVVGATLATLAIFSHARADVYSSRAEVWADTALKDPWNAKAWANLAGAHIDGGHPEFAESSVREIERIRRDAGIDAAHWPHQIRGSAALAQEDFAAASEHFSEALLLEPDDPALEASLGDVLVHLGCHEEALLHLDAAIARTALPAKALWAKIRALNALDRGDEARAIVLRLRGMGLPESPPDPEIED